MIEEDLSRMKPPTLAQVFAGHFEIENTPATKAPAECRPLLKEWPKGYERGSFRLDGDDVLIFAEGKPTLRLKGSATV